MQAGPRPRHFASDNNSAICPEAWNAITLANEHHCWGYGDDPWTERACEWIRQAFETQCDVFLVFNGTAANALALAAICRPFHAVICHASSHIQHDECGAPEFFSGGAKLLTLPGDHGRLSPDVVEETIASHFPLHASKPAALSLTQATECGTVYSPSALASLTEVARRHGLKVHMDGARFANAVATLGVRPREVSWGVGVDILSLGLTKNGGFCAEAIVVFDRELGRELDYRIKQGGQLASKMRFLAASWVGLLERGAWLRHALYANAMAERLAAALEPLPGVVLSHPREANGVFVQIPSPVIQGLRALGWNFYVFEGDNGCRLMCSWDTTSEDVDQFAADVRKLLLPSRA